MEARDRDVRRLDALQGLLERVIGTSLTEAADAYTPALRTDPGETLSDDRKQQIRDELERLCFERLAPLVLAVYEAQLKLGNLDAARDMGLSLGILKRGLPAAPKIVVVNQPQMPPEIPVNTVEDYRLARQQRTYRQPEDRPPLKTRLITPGSDLPS
jgi:hypothetical protein